MIIKTKEEFEALPASVQAKAHEQYGYDEFWDTEEHMDYFTDRENPGIHYEKLTNWSVDWCRSDITAVVDIDVCVAWDNYYHYNMNRRKTPDDYVTFLKNHYWMFLTLFRGTTLRYDGSIEAWGSEWYYRDVHSRLEKLYDDFVDHMCTMAESWKSNAEAHLTECYAWSISEELLIENLISNEWEIDYED